jgi:hypothetical protein
MRPMKAGILSTIVFLAGTSLALAQAGGGGAGGAGGGAGGAGAAGAAGTTGAGTTGGPVSGTGPAPAPTPGQSFTTPSNAGTVGTGTTNDRIPSGTGPTPAPTQGQSVTPGVTNGQSPSLGNVPSLNPSTGTAPSGTTGQSSRQPLARGGCSNGGVSGPAGNTFGAPNIMRDPTAGSNQTAQSSVPSNSPTGFGGC